MKVTVEQLPQRQLVLNIEPEPQEIEESRKVAYRHILGRIRVPGFRQGKAPMAVVERYAGKVAFLEEALSHLVPDMTQRALEEQGIVAVRPPEIEVLTTEPIAWKATVDLPSEVDLGSYRDLRFAPDLVIVEPKEVDDALERLRSRLAPWEPVDRPAEMGDLLVADVTVREDGRVAMDEKSAQFVLAAESRSPFPGFMEDLVGLSKGGAKEFSRSLPADYKPENFAGKTYDCAVAVSEVKAKALPALDDEFAKSVGERYDSLAALREQVEKDLRDHKENEAREALTGKAFDVLVQQARVTYSPKLVEDEVARMQQEREERIRQNRISMDQYLKTLGMTQEQVTAESKPAAEQRVVRALVADKLREAEGIEVSEAEVAQTVRSIAAVIPGEEKKERFLQGKGSDEYRLAVRQRLLAQKTLRRLYDIVTEQTPAAVPETREE